MGYIYILTNPSFKDYVKIGYADNVENRVSQLNNSEAVPFAFRVFATYMVDERLQDQRLHSMIDRLNPQLRSVDKIGEKIRKREFYAMSPEDAYAMFEDMAIINGCANRLKLWKPTVEEKKDIQIAEKIQNKLMKDFFTMGLKKGDEIYWKRHPEFKARIHSERELEYKGKIYTPSKLLWGVWMEEAKDKPKVGTPYDELKYDNEHINLSDRFLKMYKKK